MLAAGIKAPVPLEELEIHLREEIERQMKSGLPGQEAFEISARRIGQPETLRVEFMKTARLDKVQLRRRAGYPLMAKGVLKAGLWGLLINIFVLMMALGLLGNE